MFGYDNLSVTESGNLTIGGIDACVLAKELKTPLYVMDEEVIRKNCRRFTDSMARFYNSNGLVCYASKAFCCKEIYRVMREEGMGADVVSAGELFTAISSGFPADKICYHGNNKTEDELTLAIRHGVDRIVVDNLTELELVSEMAVRLKKKVGILLRIKPGIDAHTHDFIKTGQIDSKFGFALETGEAFEAVKAVISTENINLRGVHCHIGSQIFDISPFELAAKVMLGFIAKVKNELGYELKELNLGGGFGIRYTNDDEPKPLEEYMDRVSMVINDECERLGINRPFIILEPGRSIVAEAGITLYKIGAVKDIPNIRRYVSCDGGMTDNPRYIMYGSKYDFLIANKADRPRDDIVTIAGRCCETGDLLGENVSLQKCETGDILAVLSTGAYNYSMSSSYNRVAKPAVVFVSKGKVHTAVKRETLEDIIRNDV